MGVYHTNNQDSSIIPEFNITSMNSRPINTWDGLVYTIFKNPLRFIADNYVLLKDTEKSDLINEAILSTKWLEEKEIKIDKFKLYLTWSEYKINSQAGFSLFAKDEVLASLNYYVKAIDLADSHKLKGYKDIDQVYGNLGVCLIALGQVEEGIDLLSYAYDMFESHKLELDLYKYQLEFGFIEDISIIETKVKEMLNDSANDENLSFLVWYYDFLGEKENSITSYMQIQNIEIRFKLVDYYMLYMLESKQQIAMESFLKPLRDVEESRYILALIDVYILMNLYEEALELIDKYDFSIKFKHIVNLKLSYCYLKLNRIIESIRAINKINKEQLTHIEEEAYYVQLARLSKFSKDLSKEHIYHQSLLSFWQKQYRSVYSGILHNTKWKVKK